MSARTHPVRRWLRALSIAAVGIPVVIVVLAWVFTSPATDNEASNTAIEHEAPLSLDVKESPSKPSAGALHEPATFDPNPFDVSLSLAPYRPKSTRGTLRDELLAAAKNDGLMGWHRSTIGKANWKYPNSWERLKHGFRRLGYMLTGVQITIPGPLPLNNVVSLYALERFHSDGEFTVFYAPDIDSISYIIQPITVTNAGRITFASASLDRLLSSNGLRVIHSSFNSLKIAPASWTNSVPELPFH